MRNLKIARIRMGMTQKDLADALEVSEATIASYECGRREPKCSVLIRISEILNCSIDFLLKGGNP